MPSKCKIFFQAVTKNASGPVSAIIRYLILVVIRLTCGSGVLTLHSHGEWHHRAPVFWYYNNQFITTKIRYFYIRSQPLEPFAFRFVQSSNMPTKEKTWKSIMATFIAALGPIGFGYNIAYSSSALEDLGNDNADSNVHLTVKEGSWFSVSHLFLVFLYANVTATVVLLQPWLSITGNVMESKMVTHFINSLIFRKRSLFFFDFILNAADY